MGHGQNEHVEHRELAEHRQYSAVPPHLHLHAWGWWMLVLEPEQHLPAGAKDAEDSQKGICCLWFSLVAQFATGLLVVLLLVRVCVTRVHADKQIPSVNTGIDLRNKAECGAETNVYMLSMQLLVQGCHEREYDGCSSVRVWVAAPPA